MAPLVIQFWGTTHRLFVTAEWRSDRTFSGNITCWRGRKKVRNICTTSTSKNYYSFIYFLFYFSFYITLLISGRMGAFWVWMNIHLRARPFCQDQKTIIRYSLCLSLLTSLFSYLLPKYFSSLVSSLTSWGLNAPRCMWLCHFFLSSETRRTEYTFHDIFLDMILITMVTMTSHDGGWPWHQNLK